MEMIVIVWLVCAFIGYSIGKPKDMAALGFLLGLVLGLIGILIILFIPDNRKKNEPPHYPMPPRYPTPPPPPANPDWMNHLR